MIDLRDYTTMRVSAKAKYFIEINSLADLKDAVQFARKRKLKIQVIGAGSNTIFFKDFEGLVLRIQLKGIEIVDEDESQIKLKVAAGEDWNELVMYCVDNNWGGIENLALIPGTVGAAPVQNIGAYGVELEDVFTELEAFMLATDSVEVMSNRLCNFRYRASIFKHELKDKAIILNVTLTLQKNHVPDSSYDDLHAYLKAMGIKNPGIKQVCDAVVAVRSSKLPDPNELSNTGSFFQNPIISVSLYNQLKQKYPDMPSYPLSNFKLKVPAGWLIEKAGWKGFRDGDAGVYPKQALIIVNYGHATAAQILKLSKNIQIDVYEKFGITLTPEVNLIEG